MTLVKSLYMMIKINFLAKKIFVLKLYFATRAWHDKWDSIGLLAHRREIITVRGLFRAGRVE